jgi:hypothetical protein
MKNLIKTILFLILGFNCISSSEPAGQIYIRLSQIGFLGPEEKSAIVLSKSELGAVNFDVINSGTGKKVYSGMAQKTAGRYSGFNFIYNLDFSSLNIQGSYYLKVGSTQSLPFSIGDKIYSSLTDGLLGFFQVQRCGYTNPIMHNTCHIADATAVIDGKNRIDKKLDVTGGWHDAGDYVKFLNTTAVAAYTLLFAYDFDPVKFGFDRNNNNVPDILEEAKVGLDWLLRCYYSPFKLVTQVQDLRDHDYGWRMPENDPLQFDRPAFIGIGKNLIGIYTATLALASKIWKEKIKYYDFAEKCLNTAQAVYTIRSKVPDLDTSGTGHYLDKEYAGKLALGAYELYSATGRKEYLSQSTTYADQAGSDYWWSWGNINSFAHYRLASYDRKYVKYIEKNLARFSEAGTKNVFGLGAEATWGTTNTLLGITLQAILYKKITGDGRFDHLGILQRDFVTGRNPWGVCLISGFGGNPVRELHHQISYLNGGKVTGALAAGPVKRAVVQNQKIPYEKSDQYSIFQSDEFYYRDERVDFITNEPTIVGNATALFVYGFFTK